MTLAAALRALGPIDLRNVGRDPLLRWFVFMPLVFALIVRWLMPAFLGRLSLWIGFDLQPHYVPLMSFMLLMMVPNIVGIVIGFMLLDQRDDQTLSALQVTPLSLKGYLAYRLSIPMLLAPPLTLISFPLAGLDEIHFGPLLLACLTAAPMSPILAVFLAAFSNNKVQGFALMKASGAVLWPPLISYFFPMPWQMLAGFVPPYWAGKLYWSALAGDSFYWVYCPIGLALQAALLYALLRRFTRIMH